MNANSTDMAQHDVISEFESHLRRGVFYIPQCNTCKKTIWPPSEFCDVCMEAVSLKVSNDSDNIRGRIIECVGIMKTVHVENKHCKDNMQDANESIANDTQNTPYDNIQNAENHTITFLCLVELGDGIRLIAHMDSHISPVPDSPVILTHCGMNQSNSEYMFKIKLLEQN